MQTIKRAGVIGDAHGEDKILENVLNFFQTQRLDAILCVGDVIDGARGVDRCFELLAQSNAYVIAGNHERWFLTNEMRNLPDATHEVSETTRAYMAKLPRTIQFDTPAGGLLLCHGVGEDDMAELGPETRGYGLQSIAPLKTLMLDPSIQMMIGGHTHERMVRKFPGLTVINAGSLCPKDSPCCLIIDFEKVVYEFYQASEENKIMLIDKNALPIPDSLPSEL